MRLSAFRQGLPLIDDYLRLIASDTFRDMSGFSDQFLTRAGTSLESYRWASDPFNQWSRQYEYPFVFGAIRQFASKRSKDALQALDAGSGITFFPYYVESRVPNVSIDCCDVDGSLWALFSVANQVMESTIRFHATDLRHLSLPSGTYDIAYCISVLEHTADYDMILREFERILRPGGMLVLTFDVCLEGSADIPTVKVRELVDTVGKYLCFSGGFDAEGYARNLPAENQVLTTRFAGKRNKALLPIATPWRTAFSTAIVGLLRRDMRPLLKFVATMNHMSCFCLTAEKPE